MAAQWEQQPRGGSARRRLLMPAGLIIAGVVAGVVLMPSTPSRDFPITASTEAPRTPDEETTPPAAAPPTLTDEQWDSVDAGRLSPRDAVNAVSSGDEIFVWGGRRLESNELLTGGAIYDVVEDDWEPIPDAPIPGRLGAAAAWTGAEFVVWGGERTGSWRDDGFRDPALLADGAAFDPRTGRWRTLPAAPLSPRRDATAVATGGKVVIWGGRTERGRGHMPDGAMYDPRRNRWTMLPPGPLAGLADHDVSVVPIDNGMFVWSSNGRRAICAAFDPRTGEWRSVTTPRLDPEEPVAFAAVDGNVLAWGRTTIGSRGAFAMMFTTNPDWWSTVAVPPFTPEPGQELLGGEGVAVAWSGRGPGVVFDALANRWQPTAPSPTPRAVGFPAQVWAGDRLFVWHGLAKPGAPHRAVTWRRPSPWRQVPPGPVPIGNGMSALWTGWLEEQQQVLLWGGSGDDAAAGAAYAPDLNYWEALPRAPIDPRSDHAAVFTGSEMVVLGGRDEAGEPVLDGASYLPKTRVWQALPEPPMHVVRGSVAWSGEALYSGGRVDGEVRVAERRTDAPGWRLLPAPPVAARFSDTFAVVWSGFEVWVWAADADGALRGAAWDPELGTWRRHPPWRMSGRPSITWASARMYFVDREGTTVSLGRGDEGWRRHPRSPVVGEGVEVTWTGRRLVAYRPRSNRMASLDPRGGAWAETTPPPLGMNDTGRLLWTGRHLFAFAGGTAAVQGGVAD